MEKKITIIKLGGSLITDKSTPYTMRENTIESIAHEIKDCFDLNLIDRLILIHGVGSYGHPPVLKYNLHKGFKDPTQLIHLSEAQQSVNDLKNKIAKTFQNIGIPIIIMYASSMVIGNKMKIKDYKFDALKGYLSLGMIPLLGGTMMYDSSMGFSVCSGDQLAVILSRDLKAKHLIFATDVAGVYDSDPKINKKATLIEKININEIEGVITRISQAKAADASGGMKGKLESLISAKDLIKTGLKITVLSMKEKDTLKHYFEGKKVNATDISS